MSGLDQLYQQLILDHAKAPRAKGLEPGFAGESFQVNSMCGDQVRLRVRTHPAERSAGGASAGEGSDGGAAPLVLDALSWDGRGCSISQASVSVMAELVEGLGAAEIEALNEAFVELMRSRGAGLGDEAKADRLGDAIAFEGVSQYPARVKCALLGWMALRDAMAKAAAGDDSPAQAPEGFA
jgi:nitrogen fixation NifU-like protein